jgi:glycosyltransferase A (GT-A) superfamily protein (DUF2064 family)
MEDLESTLVLFFKRPKLGFGKQRLAAAIGPEKAFAIAECLLCCAVEDMKDWNGQRVFAVESEQDLDWARTFIMHIMPNTEFHLIHQNTGNLGERLNDVDQRLRISGASNIYFIGSDAPILDKKFYRKIKTQLGRHHIMLASSSDGGVTLMGGQVPWPSMANLPWSTSDLGRELEHVCQDNGFSVKLVDGYYDVDTIHDLHKCIEDVRNDKRFMRQKLCSTYDTLELEEFK